MCSFTMQAKDLLELYQLITMYQQVYASEGIDVSEEIDHISEQYYEKTGIRIEEARNPRDAGRKRVYSDEVRAQISRWKAEGVTYREISRRTGCSLGFISGIE